ncbi:MAG: restriction endonuclease, SacI family [Flavobacteriia bacterium]|nr:restriction endonuclease, SacI family [Flavobacteriia bacterium]
MAEYLDKGKAKEILKGALNGDCEFYDRLSRKIRFVLFGGHKTYRYILINALLAKATNEAINPLCLQAGSELKGAYDARSLCHSVLVPFEREHLHNVLGGSNEPFLNKPARFPELSMTNAVRAGRDRAILAALCYILPRISSDKVANQYLTCALGFLKERIVELKALEDGTIKVDPTSVELYRFIKHLNQKSFEGEIPVIIIGTLERAFYLQFKGEYSVKTHKVNQSGASSKEVGDIDVFKKGEFLTATEVKDKSFTAADVEHAFNKILRVGGASGQFIYGSEADFDETSINEIVEKFDDKGFLTLVLDVMMYSRMLIFKLFDVEKTAISQMLLDTAIEINSKNDTKEWIQQSLKEFGWK